MQIFWKGQSCISLIISQSKQEQVRLVIDPYDESIGFKLPSMEADIVLVSHEHPDHNNVKAVGGDPFVASFPGEYEVKNIFIKGIPSFHDNSQGKERGQNTIFTIAAEDMRLCHLGDLGQKELTSEQIDRIGDVDVLFVPVGGVYTIDAKEASVIVNQIEPKVVIPIHYALPKLKVKLGEVEQFLKVMGVKNGEPEQKLLVKAKDLSAEETKVVILKP
ncbi:MAG: MBL fold metallo-hydrolase [bacterium]|nr:MBL fold metallo-hydrolase [bacterium]